MAAEWRQVVSELRYRQAGRRRGLFRPAPAQAAADACSDVLHPVIWLPDGTMAACRTTFSPAHGNAARERLYQQQSSISSMLKCSLWLLQITKDRTETISMHLFRSWSSCRSGCLPGCSSTCRDPDAGIATTWLYADMYLNGPDSFVRLEEDATALAIEQAWHRLCHQAPHFWKRSMCMCKSIAKGKLCGPESLPDAVFLNGV